jgi:hypothetical protein
MRQDSDSIEPGEAIPDNSSHSSWKNPMGAARKGALGLDSDGGLKLEFRGAKTTRDGGLPAYRELDDAPGLPSLYVSQIPNPPIFHWIHDAPGDIICPVAGYQFSYESLGLFDGLHDAHIAEVLGMNTWAVCRDQVQTTARFRKWLSS